MSGRHEYNRVLPGAPRGSLVALLSLPQCHAALGTCLTPWLVWTIACVSFLRMLRSSIMRMPGVGFWRGGTIIQDWMLRNRQRIS